MNGGLINDKIILTKSLEVIIMKQTLSANYIQLLPKIDLHCHIDGSFSTDFVKNTLSLNITSEELASRLQAPDICSGLAEYLERFDLPISCMQAPQDISDGIYDIIQNAAKENTKYIELRFAPTCSLNDNQDYKKIYEAAIKGSQKALKDFKIHSSIIVCAMRHHSEEQNLAVLKSAREYLGYGICALDLAGDEAAFPNTDFDYLFKEAKRIDMPFTIHSGECQSVENVRYALHAGAKRVGHGIALIKDTELIKECQKSHLGLELCPTSNYQTRAVEASDTYPLKAFLNNNLLATVNTDNRTVSNTTMTNELTLITKQMDITPDDLATLYKNSVEISFADDNLKNELLKYASAYS